MAESTPKEMTAAEAAKLVSREIPGDEGGKPATKPVRADEVQAFRDYGDRVVVVTVDGQKLTGKKVAK